MNRREDSPLSDLAHIDVVACAAWWSDIHPSWMVSRAAAKWLELNGFSVVADGSGLPPEFERFADEVSRTRFGHDEIRERRP